MPFFPKKSRKLRTEKELEHCGFSSQDVAELKAIQESWDEMRY
jgi:hypothetical protein